MKLVYSALFCLLALSVVHAQPLNTVNPEVMVQVADEQLENADYYNALDWYNRAYKEQKKKDNALRFKIAKLHFTLRDYKRAERWFSRVVKSDRKGKLPEAVFYLGLSQKYNGNYPDAINTLESFIAISKDEKLKTRAKLEIEGARMAMKMKKDKALRIKNAGKTVNSRFSEYSPKFLGDDLYYSSIKSKNVIILDGKEGDYFSKIYKASGQDEKNGFATSEPLGEDINRSGFHTGNVAFSEDGDKMFFTRATMTGNEVKTSEIFVAERMGNTYAKAKKLTGPNGDWIAKHPAPGELHGKEVLFFVSDMPGGKGGDDIYYCTIKDDGTYGAPVNLGDAINTPYNEETPFYRDGTLWFSSDGYPSFGGLDIFSVKWDGTKWSKPKNLGPGYNTSVDDFGFYVDATGYKGALVSNRPSVNSLKSKTCCDDIFIATVEPVAVDLDMLVFDQSKKPLKGATVRLIEMTGNTPGKSDKRQSPQSNKINFPLDLQKAYQVIVEVKGYYPDTLAFNTVGIKKTQTITKKAFLRPLPPPKPEEVTVYINQPIRLNNIYYDFDDDKILPDAEQDLNVLLDLMKKYPDMVIELSSHTDSRGSRTYNQQLSQRRADSAKRWLVARGVAPERIKAVGYGESKILNGCTNGVRCTEEQHRFNRRTEFKIIAGPTEIKIPKVIKKGESLPAGAGEGKAPSHKKKLTGKKSVGATQPKKTAQPGPKKKKYPVITLDEPRFDFGTIEEGTIVEHDFKFTNTGDADLLIEIATGSCGCTVPEWPAQPIKPGETGNIHVTFNSKEKEGDQRVDVTIVANTKDLVTEIILTGKVIPKKKSQ